MSILEVKNITKKFGAFKALDDVSLTVEEGEVVAVIGASGSGKSTLLRCVNHLETVTGGSIVIDGETLVAPDARKSGVKYADAKSIRRICAKTGMVFQHFNLFPHLTCLQNITVSPVKIYGEKPEEARERAMQLLTTVGLANKVDSYPSQLSGGQQQRVAIARSLALSPKLMLFDEPTSALDPEITGEVLTVIRKLAESRMTMLIVTHEMGFAREVASRVIYMDEGKIVEQGPPDEIFGRPKNPRLESFLKAIL